MTDNDIDDLVIGIVEVAAMRGEPLQYAVGPMSDRRVKRLFRENGLVVAKDKLCASINRLTGMGVLRKVSTGEWISGCGSCEGRRYDIVELQVI